MKKRVVKGASKLKVAVEKGASKETLGKLKAKPGVSTRIVIPLGIDSHLEGSEVDGTLADDSNSEVIIVDSQSTEKEQPA